MSDLTDLTREQLDASHASRSNPVCYPNAPLDPDAHAFACRVRSDVHASLSPETYHADDWSMPARIADLVNVAGDVAYERYMLARESGDLATVAADARTVIAALGIDYATDARLRCDVHRDQVMTPSGQTYVCATCARSAP